MSRPEDRVAVPANGHHPALSADAGKTTSPPPDAQVVDRRAASTVTPGQMAAGFGIIAALIVWLVGRRRDKRD